MILIQYKDQSKGRRFEFVYEIDNSLHINVNKISGIGKVWDKTSYDYLFAREKMIELMSSAGGFNSLTTQKEKICAAKNAVCTKDEALTVLTVAQWVEAKDSVGDLLRTARQIRIQKARRVMQSFFFDGLVSKENSDLMISDTASFFLTFVEGGSEDLANWLNNEYQNKAYYNATAKQILLDKIVSGL